MYKVLIRIDLIQCRLSVINIKNHAVRCAYLISNILISSKACISFHMKRTACYMLLQMSLDGYCTVEEIQYFIFEYKIISNKFFKTSDDNQNC